ncbi:MAG: 4-(cytidine 5'-diphospho)-2-C-methyl-D-erythritol kinase, partial [Acidimicrobiia bacterium]
MKFESVTVRAPAKINLFLQVKGRRDDGYHDIESVMQAVSLFDELRLTRSQAGSVSIAWAEGVDGRIPEKPDLVERTLGILNETVGGTQAADVKLIKRIPVAAGLAGGSSDAAAAIEGIKWLMHGELPDSVAAEVASQVGSDVGFFLRGGTCLAMGRGEVVTSLDSPQLWWVIGISDAELSTADVYERFDQIGSPNGRQVDAMVHALASNDPGKIGNTLFNDLEAAAASIFGAIPSLKDAVAKAGALGVVMTGSGPTIAGLCS